MTKNISKNKKRNFILIILSLLIIVFIGKVIYYNVRLLKYKHELSLESQNIMPSNARFTLESRSNKYANLVISFERDFDEKTPEERGNILGNIMKEFDDKRTELLIKYNLVDFKSDLVEFPFIKASTQSKNYSYNYLNKFVDGDGKEIDLYNKYENLEVSSKKTSEVTMSRSISDDEKVFAWTAAQQAVKENLKAPSTAKFPFGYTDEYIQKIDSKTFIVKSHVDAENSFGAKVRNDFSVTIVKSDSEKFTYKDLNITSR